MSSLKISRLQVEHMQNPVGIDVARPKFAWILESDKKNVTQKAYKICLYKDGNCICDTGKIESDSSIENTISGFFAESKSRYEIELTVWDNYDNEAKKNSYFETGFLNDKWQALWREPEQLPTEASKDYDSDPKDIDFHIEIVNAHDRDFSEFRPCQYVRIPFEALKNVKSARAYVASHGIYKLYVNGSLYDDREFCPDNTAYQEFIQYQTYELEHKIHTGKNILGLILADGWWCGRIGGSGDSCQYGDRLGFIAQIEIEYEDGSRKVITSENSKSHTGPLIFSDIFVGEKYDATKELLDWCSPEYDDSAWADTHEADYARDCLIGQYGYPVRPIFIKKPIRIFRTPKGETIVDSGQVQAGQLEFTINAPAGLEIKFEHSEVLDKDGNFFNNILGINKEQTDIYITKEGLQTYRPYFTYHGFRYVKITGWPGELNIDDFKIYTLTSEMEDIGTFETSDERLNQLQHNIYFSQISNTLSIPTDCPQRERAGWTGDIMAFVPTMAFNRDCDAFLTRWMRNVRIDQRDNGAVPDVVPYIKAYQFINRMNGTDTSCGWGDAVIIVPLSLYLAYGDKQVLIDNYDAMTRWMRYIDDRCKNSHPEGYETWDNAKKERSRYLWNTDFHFGDWLVPSMVINNPDGGAMIETAMRTKEYVAPAYYAFSARTMSQVAEILGKDEDSRYYSQLYDNIRRCYIEEYVSEDGSLPQELQGLYVIALKNNLVHDELRQGMIDHLRNMIVDNDYRLDTGFLSVLWLMDVLCENGMKDLACRLLYQNKCPSWMYEIEQGATTMWESWAAILEDGTVSTYSYNHYAFGCVGDWMYRTLGGLQQGMAGYKKIIVKPDYDFNLTHVKTTQKSPYGDISVEWEKEDDNIKLQVKVPVNTTACIYLNDNIETVGSGKYEFSFTL